MLYFRLLRRGVDDAASVVTGGAETKGVATFLEEMNTELKDRVFAEFNTLSCVYGEPSEMFTDEEYAFGAGAEDPTGLLSSAGDESKTSVNGWGDDAGAGAGASAPAPAPAAADAGLDLLGFFDSPAPAPAPAAASSWALAPGAVLAPADYQNKWMSLPDT